MTKIEDGQVFGRWTVIRKDDNMYLYWVCKCSCGKVKSVYGPSLNKGKSKSCGCLMAELVSGRTKTHGYSKGRREYNIFKGMVNRCYDERYYQFDRYGGRGIIVCDRWRYSFQNFINDMGDSPGKEYSLDRIDVNGNYEPSNCRWATWTQQQNNRSNNTLLTFNGRTLTQSQWEKETGICQKMISQRIRKHGWSVERALTQPIKKISKR